MRVAIIVPGFSAGEDDWCIPVLLTLVRRLTSRLDIEIFALRYPPGPRRYDVAGAQVHALGGSSTRGWGKAGLLWRAVRAVVSAHRARPFDVLHGMWADEPGAVAVTAARLLGLRAVVSIMGGELADLAEIGYGVQGSLVGRAAVRHALRRGALITAGSSTLARAVPPEAASRLRIMPLGVDIERFQPGGDVQPLAGGFKILHVASLTPVKDQATLLAAMRDMVSVVPAHLHIVGDGPLREHLEARVRQEGLGGSVTFHGAVPHDRLPAFYRGADISVVSSRHESQSMVALESCACGCPVVGTAVGLLPDLGTAARVVKSGDAAALAREVIGLAENGDMRSTMGREARALVERAFAVDQTVALLIKLYSEAAGQLSDRGGRA